MGNSYRSLLTAIVLFPLLSIFYNSCRTTMSVEDAKEVAVKFHGEAPTPPPVGLGPEIESIVDEYEDSASDKYCPDHIPAPSPKKVALIGRSGYFRLQEFARREYFVGNIDHAIIYSKGAVARTSQTISKAECQFDLALFTAESGDFIGGKKALNKARGTYYAAVGQKLEHSARGKWELKRKYLSTLSEASIHFAEGDMAGAESWFYQALDALMGLRETPAVNVTYSWQPHLIAHVKIGIARSLFWQGRLLEAEVWAREALEHHNDLMLPRIFITLSRIFQEQGRFEQSKTMALTAVNMFTSNRLKLSNSLAIVNCTPTDSLARAFSRQAVARACLALGQYEEALEQFDTIKKEMKTVPETYRRIFEGDRDLGTAFLMTGQAKKALFQFSGARKAAARFGEDHYTVYEAEALHALALAQNGEGAAALNKLDNTVDKLLSLRGEGIGYLARQQRLELIVEGYVDLLAEAGDPESISRGFKVAGACQSRSVGKALAESSARIATGDPELTALIRQRQDLQMNLEANRGRMVTMTQAKQTKQSEALLNKLKSEGGRLKKAIEALDTEVAKRFPDYQKMISSKTVSVEDVRQVMEKDEAMVSFFCGEKATYAWAFGKTGEVAFARIPTSSEELGQNIASLRKAVTPEIINTLADIPAFDTQLANKLYKTLLAPVVGGWKDTKVIMTASNAPLDQLPLSLLVAKLSDPVNHERGKYFSGYQNVKWLVRTHAVSRLPSAASLLDLRERPTASPVMKPFVGFGDPWFTPVTDTDNSKKMAAVTRGLHLRATPVARGIKVDSVKPSMLPHLPETANEVREIAKALGANPQTDVFCGKDASEAKVKTIDLHTRKVIAFATHGLLPGDLDGLHQPALALTVPSVAGDTENDGLLTMGEIMWLSLNADWVVLSACNTAAADRRGEEAVSGLGQAFFYAGANSLLVTGWPVETESAKALTTALFRRQAKNTSLGKAEALRQARLSLIDGPGGKGFTYAHPLFWAPFILVGEGGK